MPLDYLAQARDLVDQHGLGLHLDGARVFNASVKLGVPVTDISRHFDSVSVCLSKGLCAPVGSVLCGTMEIIEKALRWRKMLGGGMRQAGVLAAAGMLSLTEQVQHLHEDHETAERLARAIVDIPGLAVDLDAVQTNMVFARVAEGTQPALVKKMADEGVLVSESGDQLRLVTHFDFNKEQIDLVAAAFVRAFAA